MLKGSLAEAKSEATRLRVSLIKAESEVTRLRALLTEVEEEKTRLRGVLPKAEERASLSECPWRLSRIEETFIGSCWVLAKMPIPRVPDGARGRL